MFWHFNDQKFQSPTSKFQFEELGWQITVSPWEKYYWWIPYGGRESFTPNELHFKDVVFLLSQQKILNISKEKCKDQTIHMLMAHVIIFKCIRK